MRVVASFARRLSSRSPVACRSGVPRQRLTRPPTLGTSSREKPFQLDRPRIDLTREPAHAREQDRRPIRRRHDTHAVVEPRICEDEVAMAFDEIEAAHQSRGADDDTVLDGALPHARDSEGCDEIRRQDSPRPVCAVPEQGGIGGELDAQHLTLEDGGLESETACHRGW